MKRSTNNQQLTLDIKGTFGTAEVQELIEDLGEQRRHMEPAVIADVDDEPLRLIPMELTNAMNVTELQPDGTIHLEIRSSRYGWQCFQLQPHIAQALAQLFITKLQNAARR